MTQIVTKKKIIKIVEDARKMAQESKMHDQRMKKEIRKDHIAEMFGGKRFKKDHLKSEFMDQYSKEIILKIVKSTQMT